MEKNGETSVARQATFDTVRREKRKLDLPVIGSQDNDVISVGSAHSAGSSGSTKKKPKPSNASSNESKSKVTPPPTKTTSYSNSDSHKDAKTSALKTVNAQSKSKGVANDRKDSTDNSVHDTDVTAHTKKNGVITKESKRVSNSNAKSPSGTTEHSEGTKKGQGAGTAKASALKNLNTKRNQSPHRKLSTPKREGNKPPVHTEKGGKEEISGHKADESKITSVTADATKNVTGVGAKQTKVSKHVNIHIVDGQEVSKQSKHNNQPTNTATSAIKDKEEKHTKRSNHTQNETSKVTKRNTLPTNNAPVGTSLTTNVEGTDSDKAEDTKTIAIDEKTNQLYVRSPSPAEHDKSPTIDQPDIRLPSTALLDQNTTALPSNPSTASGNRKMDRRESYQSLYAERNTLLNAEIAYRKRIKQLEDEANGFLKVIEDLTSENKSIRNKLDKLDSNGVKVEGEHISLGNKHGGSEDKEAKNFEELQQQIRELKAQIIRLQTENQAINEENVKIKAENYENVKKLHSLEAEAKSLAKSVTAVESEKLDTIKDLTNDHTTLKKEVKSLKDKNKELESKVNSLEYENTSLSETLAQKKSELSELLGVMKDENKFDNELKDLKDQVVTLQKEKRELELNNIAEKRRLVEEVDDIKPKLEETTKQLDEKKIKADELEAENTNIKGECGSLRETVSSQQSEIDELKDEIERLKRELASLKEMYDSLLHETENAQTDLNQSKTDLETFNKELQSVVNDKENKISKLMTQLEALKEEKTSDISKAKKEMKACNLEIDRLKVFEKNMGRMESEIKHLVDRLDESELKKKQLAINLEDKGFEVSNLEQQIFEMNMKIDSSSQRMNLLDKDKREMEKDKREWEVKRDKFNDIEASNKRLLEENKRLRSQLEMINLTNDTRPPEPAVPLDKPIVDGWVSDKNTNGPSQHAIYVQKEKERKKVQIATQPTTLQKRRVPFSKSSPVKASKTHTAKREMVKVTLDSSRSMEDIRKTPEARLRSPESEISLPELQKDAKLTGGYGMSGYRQIHRNRIRAAPKRVF